MPKFVSEYGDLGEKVEIYYEVHGSGSKKALLVMGLGTTLESWAAQQRFLSENPQIQVCVMDNRDVGRSFNPFLRTTTKQMSNDVIELIRHLEWKNVHIVGISMGGMITLEAITRAPELFASATLLNTHAGRTMTPLKGMYLVLASAFEADLEKKVTKYYREMLHGSKTNDKLWEEYRELTISNLKKRPKMSLASFFKQASACNTHYVSKARLNSLKNSHLRMVVVVSDEDVLVNPANGPYLAKELGAELIEMKGYGHGLLLEALPQINSIIEGNILGTDAGKRLHS
eukprot:Nk52_evm76s554 gene=Nk52_evmTU76s554